MGNHGGLASSHPHLLLCKVFISHQINFYLFESVKFQLVREVQQYQGGEENVVEQEKSNNEENEDDFSNESRRTRRSDNYT